MAPTSADNEPPYGPLARYDYERLSAAVFYDTYSPLGQAAVRRGLSPQDYENLRFQREEPGLNLKDVFSSMRGALKRSGGISGEPVLAAPEETI